MNLGPWSMHVVTMSETSTLAENARPIELMSYSPPPPSRPPDYVPFHPSHVNSAWACPYCGTANEGGVKCRGCQASRNLGKASTGSEDIPDRQMLQRINGIRPYSTNETITE